MPSLEKHFSVRLHLHSQHWTHFACQDLSSTFKRNLSRIGRSQPAQRTIFMSSVVRSRGRAPRPLHEPRVSTLADLIPGGSYERPSSPTESNSKGRILEKVGSMRVLVFAFRCYQTPKIFCNICNDRLGFCWEFLRPSQLRLISCNVVFHSSSDVGWIWEKMKQENLTMEIEDDWGLRHLWLLFGVLITCWFDNGNRRKD